MVKLKRPKHLGCLTTILVIILAKVIWVSCLVRDNGSFETEKEDILQRRNYLVRQIAVKPQQLIDKMPGAIGSQFQGEWALYSCSMLSAALTNIACIFPETRNNAIQTIDSLIGIVLSHEICRYDAARWYEYPLESLDGNKSHVSYLSHLAWMISGYKCLGGGHKHDELFHSLCSTMNRRILQSKNMNLQTYPGEPIYIPDMLVAIVALANYSKLYNGKYADTVDEWIRRAKTEWIDAETGLLYSMLTEEGEVMPKSVVRGSYSALNCYYLTFVDEGFAREQYERLKDVFLQRFIVTGFKEYSKGFCLLGMDVDSGPIILRLSPSGTAFAVGSATYFEDFKLREKLLKTAEIAGSTVRHKDEKHYLLANVALVGEAIMLAMRTAASYPL